MKVVESKRKNIKEFYEIAVGTVFRYNKNVFMKTNDFFSVDNIECYFSNNDIMEDVDDMYNDYLAYNAICLSSNEYNPFSVMSENTEVEVLEAELHIV